MLRNQIQEVVRANFKSRNNSRENLQKSLSVKNIRFPQQQKFAHLHSKVQKQKKNFYQNLK